MNEPLLQAGVQAEETSLWNKAPAWRGLAFVASFLTLVAVSLPILLPEENAPMPHSAFPAPTRPATALAARPAQSSLPSSPPRLAAPRIRAVPYAAPATNPVQTASLPADSAPVPPPPAPLPATTQPAEASPQSTCALAVGTQIRPMGAGVVTGFEDPAGARQRMLSNESALGASISPAYAATPRAIVRVDGNRSGGGQIVVLPPGVTVHIGDHLAYTAIHRDPGMPCAYVPPLASADDGPVPINTLVPTPAPQP